MTDLRTEIEAHRLAIRLGDDVEALAAGDRMCAALEAVVGLHIPDDDRDCWGDGDPWPCPTLRAITAVLTETKEPSDG